jgi:DNA-binding MarR family transcriptional regulator
LSRQVLTPQVSAQTVFARLLHAHGSLVREIEARLLAEHNLSANDFETLLHLSHADHGAMRRIDLAERLRLTPSGVTRLLDGLERSGLTDRGGCPTDARVTYAVITDDGRQTLQRAACTHAAACDEVIGAHLSPAELEELAGLLGRLPGCDDVDARGCTDETRETG